LAEVGPVYPTLVGLGHRDGLVDPNSTARFHWLADELRGGGKSDIGWRRAHRGYREGGGRSRTSRSCAPSTEAPRTSRCHSSSTGSGGRRIPCTPRVVASCRQGPAAPATSARRPTCTPS